LLSQLLFRVNSLDVSFLILTKLIPRFGSMRAPASRGVRPPIGPVTVVDIELIGAVGILLPSAKPCGIGIALRGVGLA
jgi:hypothetical protein